jgi:hypothetical protein
MAAMRGALLVILAAGCGRIHFPSTDASDRDDGLIDTPIDNPPGVVTLRIGERPGATSLGTTDTTLDSTMPAVNHGADTGLSCDPPEFLLLRFELPVGVPQSVLSAELHIGVTSDRLENGVAELYEMQLAWVELEATWNERAAGVAWPVAGAAGGSRATTPFGSFDGRMLFTDYIVTVPTDLIMRWWTGSNFGLGMRVTGTLGVNIGPHEDTTDPNLRPELVVTYRP